MEMKCNSCQAEWKNPNGNTVKNCPFCQASLMPKPVNIDTSTKEGAILWIVAKHKPEYYLEKSKLIGLFKDLLCNDDILTPLCLITEKGASEMVYKVKDKPINELKVEFERILDNLHSKTLIPKESFTPALALLFFGLDIDVSGFTQQTRPAPQSKPTQQSRPAPQPKPTQQSRPAPQPKPTPQGLPLTMDEVKERVNKPKQAPKQVSQNPNDALLKELEGIIESLSNEKHQLLLKISRLGLDISSINHKDRQSKTTLMEKELSYFTANGQLEKLEKVLQDSFSLLSEIDKSNLNAHSGYRKKLDLLKLNNDLRISELNKLF